MSGDPRSYQIDLFDEHLEEASFLYDQRRAWCHDPEIIWPELASPEVRLEAHQAGLQAGGALALETCLQRAVDGDAGVLYAVVCLLCRQDRFDLLALLLPELDLTDAETLASLEFALCREAPNAWLPRLPPLTGDPLQLLVPVVFLVSGQRRFRIPDARFLSTAKTDPAASFALARYCGRLGLSGEAAWLANLLIREADPAVRQECALALLRIGERGFLDALLAQAPQNPWALLPLALGAGPSQAAALLGMARKGALPDEGTAMALGLLGDPAAVDLLMAALSGEHAAAAALSLSLMTGADLIEEVFIPEEEDPDELTEEELAASDGIARNPNGEPAGEDITRICQDPQIWQDWWHQNKHRFETGTRYRRGLPFSPRALMESLRCAQSANREREAASHELLIRFGYDLAFETGMTIDGQQQALATCADWTATHDGDFQAGGWTFHGSSIT